MQRMHIREFFIHISFTKQNPPIIGKNMLKTLDLIAMHKKKKAIETTTSFLQDLPSEEKSNVTSQSKPVIPKKVATYVNSNLTIYSLTIIKTQKYRNKPDRNATPLNIVTSRYVKKVKDMNIRPTMVKAYQSIIGMVLNSPAHNKPKIGEINVLRQLGVSPPPPETMSHM